MKRVLPRLSVALIGLVLIVAGFVYDLAFAGIPYQDPTPEMQADWSFHSRLGGWIEAIGMAVFLVGLVIAPVMGRLDR
jgi:hypothetical protein